MIYVIDEEETFRMFGYHSFDLKPKSHKKVIAKCDGCGKVRILSKSSYSVFCHSCTIKGERHPLYGKHHSKESKEKMRQSHLGIPLSEKHKRSLCVSMGKRNQRGENNPAWKGGVSFEPYCEKFNDAFKEKIRNKFDRTCFLCNRTEEEIMKEMESDNKEIHRLSVHHVNYNKNCLCNDSECEFVPLCISCHIKTNTDRKYWETFLMKKLKERDVNK